MDESELNLESNKVEYNTTSPAHICLLNFPCVSYTYFVVLFGG